MVWTLTLVKNKGFHNQPFLKEHCIKYLEFHILFCQKMKTMLHVNLFTCQFEQRDAGDGQAVEVVEVVIRIAV